MALQTIKPGVILHLDNFCGKDINAGLWINNTDKKLAFIFEVGKTGSITKIGFRVGAVTTAQTLRVSLQTVDATTGNPTGTLYGGSAAGTQSNPAANTYYTVTLGTPATATQGDMVAIVIQFHSTAGDLRINYVDSVAYISTNLSYAAVYVVSWLKYLYNGLTHVEYSDNSIEPIPGFMPLKTSGTNISFNVNSSPDEKGIKFKVPFPCNLKYIGILWGITPAGNLNIKLYDANNNVLVNLTGNKVISGGIGNYWRIIDYELSKDIWYRLTVVPTEATNVTIVEDEFPSNDILDALPLGKNCFLTSRTDGGAWTDTNTKRPLFHLVFDSFDDGVGAGVGETSHVF